MRHVQALANRRLPTVDASGVGPPEAVTTQSRLPFAETVAELSRAIAAAGNTIFATIDQSAAAAQAGLSLPPTTLILFGNPKAGTPLMEAYPAIGLELPLKLLVWQRGTAVYVSYVTSSAFAARYGVTGMDAAIAAMDRALLAFAHSVARARATSTETEG